MIKKLLASLAIVLGLASPAAAGAILPNGVTQFVDPNGAPYAGGSVYMYSPGTTTCKTTYSDSALTVPNTCPITLDSAGRAQIWGAGSYRQQLYDATSNLIWDQITSDGNPGAPIYAGVAGGTANAPTVTAPGFASTNGQAICFTASATSTASATLTPNGGSAIALDKDAGAGPISTTGGELVIGNKYCATYDTAISAFHLEGFWTYINWNSKSVSVSSVGQTVDLGASGSNFTTLSGTNPNTITSFGSTASTTQPFYYVLVNSGGFAFINSTAIQMLGGVSQVAQTGDLLQFRYLGSGNWQQVRNDGFYSSQVNKSGWAKQTATSGPYDTLGNPTFLPSTSVNLNLTTQNITSTVPLTVDSGNGVNAQGYSDLICLTTSNLTWSSLTPSLSSVYLYVSCNNGTLTTGFTATAPVYQYGGTPAVTNGVYTFVISTNTMYLGNGSTASAVNVVFVGQATTSGSAVTATIQYNYNGRCHYQTASNLPAGSTATAVPCYFGHNVGLTSKLTAVNVISELNYTVGQIAEIDQASSNVAIFDGVSMKMLTVAGGVQTKNYSTGAVAVMTVADWRWIADVWRTW